MSCILFIIVLILHGVSSCTVSFANRETRRLDSYNGTLFIPSQYSILGCSANRLFVKASKETYDADEVPLYDFDDGIDDDRVCCLNLNNLQNIKSIRVDWHKRSVGQELCFAPHLENCAKLLDTVDVIDVHID